MQSNHPDMLQSPTLIVGVKKAIKLDSSSINPGRNKAYGHNWYADQKNIFPSHWKKEKKCIITKT